MQRSTIRYQGTSVGAFGYRISEMFGGDGNGSWINTPLPNDTAVHTDSATAVADIVMNVRDHATGTSTLAWPTLNNASYTATLNVIDSSKIPLKPVTITGSNASASWAFATAAMMYAGFPLPDGLHPTADSDGTIHLYDPDWKWVGRPADTQYWGRIWELWGAMSPEQNAAAGNAPVWTAKFGGRLTGVNQRLYAHPINRTSTADVLSQASPSYGAPKAPNDTSGNTTYWGYGPDGVYESSVWMASASHIPMSHHILRMSDVANGVITHPLGFALFPMYPLSEGSKGSVWPATGYDAASRNWFEARQPPSTAGGIYHSLPFWHAGVMATAVRYVHKLFPRLWHHARRYDRQLLQHASGAWRGTLLPERLQRQDILAVPAMGRFADDRCR